MNIQDLFERIHNDKDDEPEEPRLDPTIQLIRIQEAASRFQNIMRFKIGTVITPTKDGVYNNHGDPHLVIDVRDAPYDFGQEPFTPLYGIRLDTRILCLRHDRVYPIWVESAHYMSWEQHLKELGNF